MKITSVDLNCDMGEGMLYDKVIMPYISSANIACGYHAGDKKIMQDTIMMALENNVKIGAHPSFPDRENFGRTNMFFSSHEIATMVQLQLETLMEIALKNNTVLYHVKPHGALYNQAFKDEAIAEGICQGILNVNPDIIVYAQSGSELVKMAQAMQLKTCSEVFADRTYQSDGSLTPRTEKNSLLHDVDEVQAHVLQMVKLQKVTVNGILIPIQADTICVHGDGDHPLDFVKRIHKTLLQNNIQIQSTYD